MRLVYLARHGETDWNVANRWQGHTDVPLNDNGRAQARALARRLRGGRIVGAVASDLSRARETALIVATHLGVRLEYVDPDLRERAFGVFEGLTRSECETQQADAWGAWLDRKTIPPGGEAHEILAARMVAAVGRAAMQVARDDAPVLAVTHGGGLRAVVAAIIGHVPPPVKNGAVWVLSWKDGLVGAKPLSEQDG